MFLCCDRDLELTNCATFPKNMVSYNIIRYTYNTHDQLIFPKNYNLLYIVSVCLSNNPYTTMYYPQNWNRTMINLYIYQKKKKK